MEKRGQVTLFVIAAIIIIGVVVAVFLAPRINFLAGDVEPNSYLRNCIEDDARESMERLAMQGGYPNPENYVTYQDEKFTYLCYTAEEYKPCIVQQALIKKNFEDQIRMQIEPRARQCYNDLKESYESRGFDVTGSPGDLNVSFVPGRLNLEFLSPMTVTKENTQTFTKFSTSIDTEMYGLLLTAGSIVEFESTLGDTETLTYIQYYPDLSIEKIKRDGDTLYTLSNVVSGDEFQFATRSLVWPEGYGVQKI